MSQLATVDQRIKGKGKLKKAIFKDIWKTINKDLNYIYKYFQTTKQVYVPRNDIKTDPILRLNYIFKRDMVFIENSKIYINPLALQFDTYIQYPVGLDNALLFFVKTLAIVKYIYLYMRCLLESGYEIKISRIGTFLNTNH